MTFPKGSLGAAALYYASLGWPVFPLAPREKMPLYSKANGGQGLKDATTDADRISAWWTAHPTANIGLATGGAAKLFVVDVDGEDGEASLMRYGALPVVPESRTGKGRHLLFTYDARNTAGKLGPKIDTRGDGGYIVAPPSVHPNGARYRWHVAPHKADIQPLPEAMRDVMERVAGSIQPEGARASAVEVVLRGVQEGGRNQALTEYVGRLFALGHRELEVLALARAVNKDSFAPPLPVEEVEAVVRNVAAADHRQKTARSVTVSAPGVPQPMVAVDASVFGAMLDKAQQPVDALPTMWPTWNKACRMYGGGVGLARGWHVVAAGGAGAGKSLVALNLTAEALRGGHSVGWVSLEMSREQLLLRLMGIATGRRLADLEPGPYFDPQLFATASEELIERMALSGAQLWMAERPTRSLVDVDRLMRDAVEAGCRLVILDYLQLVTVPDAKMDDTMRHVSAAVQSLAYRHNVTTLALSQLNRTTTADRDNPPTIFGLMGGSSIENDADQVLLIDHTSRKDVPGAKSFTVLLDKNRHGPNAAVGVEMNTNTLTLLEPFGRREYAPNFYERESA
ncbi:replicative helicase [Caudoviricetes sp.]|nr:replicative helicase [Caudoviricetes sp.]